MKASLTTPPHLKKLGHRRAKLGANRHTYLSPYIRALELGTIRRETWRQDSKDMKHDRFFSTWLINRCALEIVIVLSFIHFFLFNTKKYVGI